MEIKVGTKISALHFNYKVSYEIHGEVVEVLESNPDMFGVKITGNPKGSKLIEFLMDEGLEVLIHRSYVKNIIE